MDLVQGNIRPEKVRTDMQTTGSGVRNDMQAAESGVRNDMQMAESGMRTTADQKPEVDEELRVTGTTGVRPAFVLPQM